VRLHQVPSVLGPDARVHGPLFGRLLPRGTHGRETAAAIVEDQTPVGVETLNIENGGMRGLAYLTENPGISIVHSARKP
jgi:hypothetical protein